jgi:hypothetical protein
MRSCSVEDWTCGMLGSEWASSQKVGAQRRSPPVRSIHTLGSCRKRTALRMRSCLEDSAMMDYSLMSNKIKLMMLNSQVETSRWRLGHPRVGSVE